MYLINHLQSVNQIHENKIQVVSDLLKPGHCIKKNEDINMKNVYHDYLDKRHQNNDSNGLKVKKLMNTDIHDKFKSKTSNEFGPNFSNLNEGKREAYKSPGTLNETFGRIDTPPLDDDLEEIVDKPNKLIQPEVSKVELKSSKWYTPSHVESKREFSNNNTLVIKPNAMKSSISALKRQSVVPNTTYEDKRSSVRKSIYESLPQKRINDTKRFSVTSADTQSSDSLLFLAKWLYKLAELEKKEVDNKNKMCLNKNFNIEYAFRLLNPVNGVVTAENFSSALNINLDIEEDDRTIINDLINRLAYIKPNKLVLSDMIFFEPTPEDESYRIYKSNVDKIQNTRDMSWVNTYKQLWEAMIETVRERRAIQITMLSKYQHAVDDLYQIYNLTRLNR